MVAAVDKGLALGNDATRYIPGHGPMATKADLLAPEAAPPRRYSARVIWNPMRGK